ncbi:hypothetical protein DID88_000317 [Monilinia fructigena]|uniref:Intradiol ring-cleavage dioxygenases domain-containing protein n=1 Tax=Monilinia fructigena TaxID=38457 RepID=A0A395IIH4_9HELO|nr:hypothetical protein DID88_000317 [Monilinia fructigena]
MIRLFKLNYLHIHIHMLNMLNTSENANGPASHKFDPNFTLNVIDAMGPKTSPRMREVMACLIGHVHDFAREVELTIDEWAQGVELLNEAGRMSDHKRNEGQLISDVIGLESLVDEITYKKAADAVDAATASAILGPFFRHDAPVLENESSIIQTAADYGEIVYMHGTVIDNKTKKPIPTPYPVPFDGPAGKILQLLDRQPFRPAHIHLIVQHENYKPLTTQIFDSKDKYLKNDSVFAVKDSLVVDFVPLKGNSQALLELNYPFTLAAQTGA